jgi:hypothetical protein
MGHFRKSRQISGAIGRAIVQAVSHWLSTAAVRVQARVSSCGIRGGADFLVVLQFPLPTFIPPIASESPSYIIRNRYNKSLVAAVPSGLSLTPLIIIITIIIIIIIIIIQFNSLLFMCRVNSFKANYRHSTV